MEPVRLVGSRKIATIALFSALAVSTDYAMFLLANIKLMDTIVFASAFVFGLEVGVAVGSLTWLVYGSVNPYGPDSLPLLALLIASETAYALLGTLARRMSAQGDSGLPARSLLWGSLGLIGAFVYDIVTIIVPTMLTGASFGVAVASLGLAIPFMVAHEASDFCFFALAGPVLVSAMYKISRDPRGRLVDRGPAPA